MKSRFLIFALIAMLFTPVHGQTFDDYLLEGRSGETFEQYIARIKREKRINTAVNVIGIVAKAVNETKKESGKKEQTEKTTKAKSRAIYPVKAPQAVDLGLPSGVLWGSCNLGATKPEETGNRYAWGEVKPKGEWGDFTKSNYKYFTPEKVTKTGGGKDSDGFEIPVKKVVTPETWQFLGDDISGTEYDAAYVALGGSWRMPSNADFKELEEQCQFESIKKNDVDGLKVTGPNGNWIFLRTIDSYYALGYWTSTAGESDGYAFMHYRSIGSREFNGHGYHDRSYGEAIRPIYVDLALIAEKKESNKKAVADLLSDVQNQISPYELEITKKYPDQHDVAVIDQCLEKMETVNEEYRSEDWYDLGRRLNLLSLLFYYKYHDSPLTIDERSKDIPKKAKLYAGWEDEKSKITIQRYLWFLRNMAEIAYTKNYSSEIRVYNYSALLVERERLDTPSDTFADDLLKFCEYFKESGKEKLKEYLMKLQEFAEWSEPYNSAQQNYNLYSILATLHEKAGNKKIAKKIRAEKL